MKIMCVGCSLVYGGAERVLTNLVNHFSQKHEVVFVTLLHRDQIPYPINENVTVVNGLEFGPKIQAIFKLRKLIRGEKPDVILSFLTHVNITTLIAGFSTGVPIVVSERNDPSKEKSRIRRVLRDITYLFADGIVFQTEDAKNYYRSVYRKRSAVIPNPIYVSAENIQYVCQKRKKEIVAVGRLSEQKNFGMLIHACEPVLRRHPDFSLVIYGEGPLRGQLEELIQELEMEGRVCLYGQTSELHTLIRDSELFVMPSNYEGMPNALMEAMALGLCCVSTDCPVGGPRMLIDSGVNGWLIPVGDRDALSRKILELLDDGEERKALGEEARKIIQTFSPERVYQEWELYLRKVSGNRTKSY